MDPSALPSSDIPSAVAAFLSPHRRVAQTFQGLGEVHVYAHRSGSDLLRAVRLPLVDACVRCVPVPIGHLPERVLDYPGRVGFDAQFRGKESCGPRVSGSLCTRRWHDASHRPLRICRRGRGYVEGASGDERRRDSHPFLLLGHPAGSRYRRNPDPRRAACGSALPFSRPGPCTHHLMTFHNAVNIHMGAVSCRNPSGRSRAPDSDNYRTAMGVVWISGWMRMSG